MTNRTLTALVIRFAALLLFMKIFEFFGAYAISVFYTASLAFLSEKLNMPFDKFYLHGTFLLISNVVMSLLLFTKAEWISSKIIKDDKPIEIQLSAESIVMSILFSTGIIWLASLIYSIPDAYEYIQMMVARFNHETFDAKGSFSPMYFIMKIIIGLLFVFKVGPLTRFFTRKKSLAKLREQNPEVEDDNTTA